MSDSMPDSAMIFAAGFGKRMRPITDTIPKPLVKVAGKALIDYTLENFANAKVDNLVVNTHYFPEKVYSHVSGRKYGNSKITISHEDEILETGGGIVKALTYLGHKPFFSANSDVIILDNAGSSYLDRLAKFWNPEKMDVLMLLQPLERAIGYDESGDFCLSSDGVVNKPDSGRNYVYTGTQIIKPELFNGFKEEPFSLRVIYNNLILNGRISGIVHDGDWLHIGTPEGIKIAEEFMVENLTAL